MASRTKYRTILLFGMPGSGKGTQGAVLGQIPDLVHISSGELLRNLPKHGELSKEVVHFTSQGLMVPDDLTVRIWQRYVKVMEMQELLIPDIHTLVLDGLPRNYAQAERLDYMFDVIQIFHLVIHDFQKVKERLAARALRENRLDDINEEVVKRRLQIYREETFKTLSFYDPALVFDVDAARPPLDVLRQIIDRMADLHLGSPAAIGEPVPEAVH